MPKRLYLLDGSALVYRAFFALQRMGLANDRGEPTGAVFGFANTLYFLVKEEKPDYLVVVFDARGPTFRHERYPEYKAHREAMPEELGAQIPRVKELVDAWPAARIEVQGVEADDVIGAYAAQLSGPDLHVIAVTGDKDFYQLLDQNVRILNPGRGGFSAIEPMLIGPDDIPDKFGVTEPRQVVDVLALMGDTSDNVPGVPGVGPKTAGKLVATYGSLEGIHENLSRLKPAQRKKLEEHWDTVLLARELVTIRTDLDLPTPLEELATQPPGGDRLADLLEDLNFQRMLKDLGLERKRVREMPSFLTRHDSYVLISDEAGLDRLAPRLRAAADGFALDTETTSVDPMRAELVGISLAPAPGEAYYVNLGHATGAAPLPLSAVRDVLGPILADPGIPKIAHHGKFDLLVLARADLPVKGLVFDTMVASYLVDPEASHKLDNLARTELGETMIPITDLIGRAGPKQKSMTEVDAETASRYAAEDADMTLRLRDVLAPKLAQLELADLFRGVEMPLLHVLLTMERTGVTIDIPFLRKMSAQLEEELARLETKCHELAEREFNINSPGQLAEVLFVHLALPRGKRTKTGYSTDSEVLESLRPHHELPGAVLEYRQLVKLKSTYVDSLPALVHPDTGRVHASFNQTVAATGRLSSSDPNLQNIPVRTPLGREVRRAFIPGKTGWVLLSADYSQIELRIMAHLSRDPALVAGFGSGIDVHRDTASRIFGVSPEEVSDLQRSQAKTVNYGVLYGQGPYGLARTLGIPTAEASAFIKSYKSQYSGVMEYQDRTLEEARGRGYVTTLLNRRRYLPGLQFKSAAARAAAERLAVNTPIQGSAADLIKVAMVELERRREKGKLKGRLLLQVHDELVLECPREEADEMGNLVRATMEGALTLDVPIVVNVGVGMNWAEIH